MIVASWLQSSAFSLTAMATKVELLWQVARRMRQRLLAVAYQTSRRRLRIFENDPPRSTGCAPTRSPAAKVIFDAAGAN